VPAPVSPSISDAASPAVTSAPAASTSNPIAGSVIGCRDCTQSRSGWRKKNARWISGRFVAGEAAVSGSLN
jgi:hypothetical protein